MRLEIKLEPTEVVAILKSLSTGVTSSISSTTPPNSRRSPKPWAPKDPSIDIVAIATDYITMDMKEVKAKHNVSCYMVRKCVQATGGQLRPPATKAKGSRPSIASGYTGMIPSTPPCNICGKASQARGLCILHYEQQRRIHGQRIPHNPSDCVFCP